jgi:hypothetical protein
VRLRAQIIDFIGPDALQDSAQSGAIGQIAIVQVHPRSRFVRIGIDAVQAARIKRGGAAHDPVHLVVLRQQEFGQKRAILARYASNQSLFHSVGDRLP